MSSISSSTNRVGGLFSGLETEDLVKAMTANTKNRINTKKQKLQTLQWKQESYRGVIDKIAEFQNKYLKVDAEKSIKANAVMKKCSATSSNDKIISASASAGSVPAKYIIKEASKATSAAISTTGSAADGSIKLDFSKAKAGKEYKVKINLDGADKEITFKGSSNASEAKANFLAEANKAFAGVKSSNQQFKFEGDWLKFDNADDGIYHTFGVGYGEAVGLDFNTSSKILTSSKLGTIGFAQELRSLTGKFDVNINGVDFSFTKDTTVSEMMDKINNSDAGVRLSFSNVSQTFTLETKDTGAAQTLEIKQKNGNLFNSLFNIPGGTIGHTAADSSKVITYEDSVTGETKPVGADGVFLNSASMDFVVNGETKTVTAANGSSITYGDLADSGLFDFKDGVLTAKAEINATSPEAENKLNELFGKSALKGESYSGTMTAYGKNSTLVLSSDGENFTKYTSAVNTFTFDGTKINVSDAKEFKAETEDDYITVETSKDTSALKDLVKEFVEDYNKILDDLYGEINTARPKSKGDYFDPLTEEQEEEMEKEEIEKWNESAKKGLLFHDSNITKFLESMRSAVHSFVDGYGLNSMGVNLTKYWRDNGKLEIDEAKLDAAIAADSDKIAELFTSENGIAAKLEKVCDRAISTDTKKYGYLTSIAGKKDTKTDTDNQIYKQMQTIQDIIDRLEEKYENEQERYWNKYTQLEKLMAQMQQQSSYFMSE